MHDSRTWRQRTGVKTRSHPPTLLAYFSIPKLQRCNRWSLGMDKWFHCRLYWACYYLSMLQLKLIPVNKSSPWNYYSLALCHWCSSHTFIMIHLHLFEYTHMHLYTMRSHPVPPGPVPLLHLFNCTYYCPFIMCICSFYVVNAHLQHLIPIFTSTALSPCTLAALVNLHKLLHVHPVHLIYASYSTFTMYI